MKHLKDFASCYGVFAFVVLCNGYWLFRGLNGEGYSLHLLWAMPLLLLGVWDLLQERHTLMRNYPLLGHIRWLFEESRPYLRQYIVEGNLSGRPFNRHQRSLVYQRAKNVVDAQPLGTELDVYDDSYEFMNHSIGAGRIEASDLRTTVGSRQCDRPYNASLLNISAMSFGALGHRAIEALNMGAARGNFYHDTGEGGISRYHRNHGGDLVWEIGTGYFGCRDKQGRFDVAQFEDQARSDQVKMVEIKLSQGAKPGHGGVLPGAKVTPEIAAARHIPVARDCISPPAHSAFSSPLELLDFAALLRERSGGKPVGIKLCVGLPWELLSICKAMLESGIRLDYIVVDGSEGGTGAAPEEFSDHVGMPLRDGLVMVRNALVGTGLRKEVHIAASGKIHSAFTMAANLALGADWCNAARPFMFALGCVQSKNCHTDRCPTGVATQDLKRQRGLVVVDKAERVTHFHHNTLKRLGELVGAAGLAHPSELRPHHLYHRQGPNALANMEKIKDFLAPNILLDDPDSTPYGEWWAAARTDTFKPDFETGPSHHRS